MGILGDDEAGLGDFGQLGFEGGAGGVDCFVEAIESGFRVSVRGERLDELLAVHFVARGESKELDYEARALTGPAGGIELDTVNCDAKGAEEVELKAGQCLLLLIVAMIGEIVEEEGADGS